MRRVDDLNGEESSFQVGTSAKVDTQLQLSYVTYVMFDSIEM